MNEQTRQLLKNKIDEAKLISFDVFDTLLFRKTNTPETVFDLVGKHFGIHGFRKLRMDEQNEASRRAYLAAGHPHANMEEIYEVLSEHSEIPVDWNAVKEYEMAMERDALVANTELLEIFRYAKAQGKRVVATSDMYLSAEFLREVLEARGFEGIDFVYCSADERKAKFNRDLFEVVAAKEATEYGEILHIGDKERDDGEFPESYGIKTFIYRRGADMDKIKNAGGSDIDKGIYKILCSGEKDFWYELGAEVGGPLYMGLIRWMEEKLRGEKKKVYFLSRDGYNLYHIFRELGYENVEYLYTSRRALTLANISEMNADDIRNLPPYTFGQTVGEILDYLCIERADISHLAEAGFESFEDVILSDEDKESFRKLYSLDKEVFLRRCRLEREWAQAYYSSIGFLAEDAICFDCGWQGSSQELLERFKKEIGCSTKHTFLYFGIKHGGKSIRQLKGKHYDAYLFDFCKNFALQSDLHENVILYELFFSAPHESVYHYAENGGVVFETGEGNTEKNSLLAGIRDFVLLARDFTEKYDVEYTPQLAAGALKRLIHMPTEKEAVMIGDLQNVDGFARKQGVEKRVAYVTGQQLEKNPNHEIYWLAGLLKRPDVPEQLKRECAFRKGVKYPAEIPEYHLEDEASIRSYHRWVRAQQENPAPMGEMDYKPFFSVVIPVYNTVTQQLEECFDSVLKQSYENFELILVDDHSSWDNVRPVLQRYESHEKVKVIYRSANGHISVATNDGIALASGEFIVFMDCDDTIEPNALYEFALKLNENPELDFIYSDEDKITEDGKIIHQPFFKPEWSPDLFMNMMYTNHLATYRASIVKAVGGLRTAYNGSQDYDFTLRFMEQSHNSRVGHVAKVLYHWRERKESVAFAMNSKNYASEAARHAKEDYIRRNAIPAHLEYIDGMSQYRTVYEVVGEPLVSILIPSKDHPGILRQCVDSIIAYTEYKNYEIVVVDNGSSGENRRKISLYLESVGAKYVYDKAEFNFSKMCNLAAANAKGEYLLFLNDDIEIFQPQWLQRMLGHAQQKHTGAVGAKLYYPESTLIQHAGVSNPPTGPLHSFMRLDDCVPYYFGWNRVDCNCIAVTGACLMLSAEKFRQAGCFDENLPVAYNDVKLCFALHSLGYYNVIRNDVAAYHHESLSRGSDQIDDRKLMRQSKELTGLHSLFPNLKSSDPFMNENLASYSAGLDLKPGFDLLKKVKLRRCRELKRGGVDSVEIIGDRIRILGWALPEEDFLPEKTENYVVFRDGMGNTFAAKALSFTREDVAGYFGKSEYKYAGFECVLSKKYLRIDLMPYRVGVMSVGQSGKRYIKWGDDTGVIRNPEPRPFTLPNRELKNFRLNEKSFGVRWCLDECSREDSYHLVRGFAFVRGGKHALYEKKLILRDENGRALEFDMYSEERIDVAYTFPREHFLFYTGYLCYVFDNTLEKGKSYDVIIRLQNCFDSGDVRDIVTQGKISI